MESSLLDTEFIILQAKSEVKWLKKLQYGRDIIFNFVHPWVSCVSFSLNFLVFLLCIIIYFKTKKKAHKPAFLYIGVLAMFDMIIGYFNIVDFAINRGDVNSDIIYQTFK